MDTNTNPNTTVTTAPMSEELVRFIAQAAVLAKIAKKEAGEAFDRAEADAMEAMTNSDILSVTLPDGTTVTVVQPDGRTVVDVEALAESVPATVFAKVTKTTVDLTKFKAAVESGMIDASVAGKVASLAPVEPSLRITAKVTKPK